MAVHCVESLLPADEVEQIVRVWHRFPFYDAVNQRPRRASTAAPTPTTAPSSDLRKLTAHTDASTPALPGRFPGIMGRADVDMHFRQTGCAAGRAAVEAGLARTNYFGANYVYHDETAVPGIERFLQEDEFVDAARLIFDVPLVVPTLVYANVMVPGQELPIHTDIPEFLGADRTQLPMWLLVVMHHSGLFADRRIATATAVAYVEGGVGGEFAYYEKGNEPTVMAPGAGNAVVLDADTVFHAVLPVGASDELPPENRAFMRLSRQGHRRWRLTSRGSEGPDGTEDMASYSSDQLRYSISRKAYCFADKRQHEAWQQGVDPLVPEEVIGRLLDVLVDRGVLESRQHALSDAELAALLIGEFIPFPDVPARTGAV